MFCKYDSHAKCLHRLSNTCVFQPVISVKLCPQKVLAALGHVRIQYTTHKLCSNAYDATEIDCMFPHVRDVEGRKVVERT